MIAAACFAVAMLAWLVLRLMRAARQAIDGLSEDFTPTIEKE